jgi:two-component system nitrate/nitrite response regulator NarL
MDRPVTVAIVEDHPVVIEGVISWITSDPLRRVRLTQVAHDLVSLAAAAGPPSDVIILDLELGGQLVTGDVSRLAGEGRRIVVFSGHSDPDIVMTVLDEGAYAYVAKDEGRDHLLEAVLAAAQDRPYVTRSQAKAILASERVARPVLSAKERQTLLLWFQGMSKASVGQRMSISEATVRQYINRARAKYVACGRSAVSKEALLARAIEDRLITPGEVTLYTSRASHPEPPAMP